MKAGEMNNLSFLGLPSTLKLLGKVPICFPQNRVFVSGVNCTAPAVREGLYSLLLEDWELLPAAGGSGAPARVHILEACV